MAKKSFSWTLNNLFAALLLLVGSGLTVTALTISFGSWISVEAIVTAAILGLVALIFLHPAPISALVPITILISLGIGYATYFSTTSHTWLMTSLAVIITASIIGYGLRLRQTIRQRHSRWYR
ncbi:hypothetical protein [Lactiplantibacillus herbarum]|uniref:hypothetical protein n=1 Tax=Lactiplantibacillus herbarum TaxID=1670446 RepID=UPI00064E9000|nr:hypothetical protein [Lactiplantibacillus herbarum]